MKKKALSLLLCVVMALSLLPAAAFAETGEAEMATVKVQFDCRSIATNDMMEACEISYPSDQTVTVPAGSTVYNVLEAARKQGNFAAVYGAGYDGTENGFLKSLGDLGSDKMEALCGKTGAAYSADIFQYAGWVYSVNGVDGQGIQTDKITADATINFRFTCYMTSGTWEYVDVPFVDAYYGIQEDIAAAKALAESDYTPTQWTALQEAIANAEAELTAVRTEDKDGCLTGGLMLNYIAERQTALWGSDSPTDKLQKAQSKLEKAVRKVVAPESVVVPTGITELQMGRTYQLNATVLPEGAPQDVIYEVITGGDHFDISETGLITPKAATSSLCMIQVKSKEDPSKLAVFMFKIKEAPDMGKLLENISLSYAQTSDDWKVMEMGAYASAFPTGTGLSKAVRQSYVDTVIDHLENGSIKGDTDYDKVILALSAIGVDPSKLYAADGKTQFDAFALLNGVSHSTSAWKAPYTLAALNLPGASGLETDADQLVDALIAAQQEDGSWNEFGMIIDSTANVIAGLSFYAGEAKVDAAIEKGVAYLASQMKPGGVYDGGYGANANSTEMVIIGLCAAGVNPDTDERFIQDGVSVLDGLLSYAVEGNTGFGYTDNKSVNGSATEQGFRALIAASQVMKTGKAYNIYDFRDNKVEPGYATWADNCMVNFKTVPADAAVVVKQDDHTISFAQDHDGYYDLAAGNYTYTVSRDGYKTKTGTFTVTEEQAQTHDRQTISVSLTSSSSSGGGSSKDIRVTVKVMVPPEDTTKAYTYKNDSSAYSNLVTKSQTVTVTSGTSVRDAMVQALDDNSIDYVEESNGYFSSINGLAEFERGKNSGWMYLVNGSLPDVTAQNYELTRNSTVTWFYTDDYTKDYGGLDNSGSSGGGSSNTPETAVDKAEKLIDAIGSVTKDSGAKIKAARDAYDALTAAQKKLVENYAKLTAAETAYAALTGGKTDFTDVPAGYWAEDGIRYVYDKGLMQGTTAAAFSPEQTTTRGMIAAILYRLENSPAVTGSKSFSDVTDGMYCADAVHWAQSCGIVNGYSDGRFAPNASITREQLAAILYRYAAYKNQDVAKKADLSAFTDAGSVSAYAKEALAWANAAGLVNGTVSGTLNPQGGATRAQSAMILMRWLEKTAG